MSAGELILYTDPNGTTRLHVRLVEGSVWLSQALMASLCGKDVRTIDEHLRNMFEEGELAPEATTRSFRIVQTLPFRSRPGPAMGRAPRGAPEAPRSVPAPCYGSRRAGGPGGTTSGRSPAGRWRSSTGPGTTPPGADPSPSVNVASR